MIDDIWRTCCRSQDSAGKENSRHHILEDQEIPKKYQKFIFYQKMEVARRRRRKEQ
jgi:hypothetical protein